MLCDFYELTMGNGYYRNGFYKRNVYFDVFFRNVPDGGGFAIAAGLEQIVEFIQQLHFSQEFFCPFILWIGKYFLRRSILHDMTAF